jgi:hypothetical protein
VPMGGPSSGMAHFQFTKRAAPPFAWNCPRHPLHASIPSPKIAYRIQIWVRRDADPPTKFSARQRASCPWEGPPPAWPIFHSPKAADHFTPAPFSFSTPQSPPLPAHAS